MGTPQEQLLKMTQWGLKAPSLVCYEEQNADLKVYF